MKTSLTLLGVTIFFAGYITGQTNTFPDNGNVGIGTTSPRAVLDVAKYVGFGATGTVLARQAEGDVLGEGTCLAVKGWETQFTNYNAKSFSIGHYFYGELNSAINFYRGGAELGGFITFDTYGGTEKMRISSNGYVGIGTAAPAYKLHVDGDIGVNNSVFMQNGSLYSDANNMASFHNGGFVWSNADNSVTKMHLTSSADLFLFGNQYIGTTNNRKNLEVNGDIKARKIKVTQTDWADYVFDSSYQLAPLSQVETFIQKNKHLPEVPSTTEITTQGLDLGENQVILLKKIEELTLYIIRQNKKINEQEREMVGMKKDLEAVKALLQHIDRN